MLTDWIEIVLWDEKLLSVADWTLWQDVLASSRENWDAQQWFSSECLCRVVYSCVSVCVLHNHLQNIILDSLEIIDHNRFSKKKPNIH